MSDDSASHSEDTRWWRRPRAFFAAAFLIPLLLLATVGAGLYIASKRGPVTSTGGNTTHAYFWSRKQDALAADATGSRMLLIGGSGVLFSVRAQALSSKLDGPAVNMGSIAGFGLDYILRRARMQLRPNDIAVLFLEYGLYVQEQESWSLADYVIPFDLPYLAHIGAGDAIKLAGLLTPVEYVRKVRGGLFGIPEQGTQMRALLNGFGDYIANTRADQKDYHRKTLDDQRSLDAVRVNPAQARKIAEFIAWCRERGVHLVAGFPAFLDRPAYHTAPQDAFYAGVVELYRERGVPILGHPREFMFPKASFFDSAYHLNDAGAAQMSQLVASRLAIITHCELFRTWTGPRSPECAHIRQPIVMDFARQDLPSGAAVISGFSGRESWGRWTDGTHAAVQILQPVKGPFVVNLVIRHVYEESGPVEVTIRAGDEERKVTARVGNTSILFAGSEATDQIEVQLPPQRSPAEAGLGPEKRHIGIGLARIEVTATGLNQ